MLSKGKAVTAETGISMGREVFFYYNQILTSSGFSLIQKTAEDAENMPWVASYIKDQNLFQIMYYKTPYTENSFTVLLFVGNI